MFYGNPNQHTGDQIRSFGYTQDGSADSIFRFRNTNGFLPRPPGTVTSLDRDEDGVFDADEIAAGTDPADPAS